MISAKNYAAQAVNGLKIWAESHASYEHRDIDVAMSKMYAEQIKNSVHFAIPDNGEIFDDDLKGLEGIQVRLPYKSITVEYYVGKPNDDCPKRLAMACEINRDELNHLCKNIQQKNPASWIFQAIPDDTVIHFVIANEYRGNWVLCPMSWVMPVTWDYRPSDEKKIIEIGSLLPHESKKRISGFPVPILPGIYKMIYMESGKEQAVQESVNDIAGEMRAVLEMCEALTCSNVTTGTLQHENRKANDKRMKKGKLPIYETKQLVIETPKIIHARGMGQGIDRSSPRQHLRRGHIRKLNNDQRIWVNSCVVGSANIGKIHKTYSVVTNP